MYCDSHKTNNCIECAIKAQTSELLAGLDRLREGLRPQPRRWRMPVWLTSVMFFFLSFGWRKFPRSKPVKRGEYFVATLTGMLTILAWNGERWMVTLNSHDGEDEEYWNRFVKFWRPLPPAPSTAFTKPII